MSTSLASACLMNQFPAAVVWCSSLTVIWVKIYLCTISTYSGTNIKPQVCRNLLTIICMDQQQPLLCFAHGLHHMLLGVNCVRQPYTCIGLHMLLQ